ELALPKARVLTDAGMVGSERNGQQFEVHLPKFHWPSQTPSSFLFQNWSEMVHIHQEREHEDHNDERHYKGAYGNDDSSHGHAYISHSRQPRLHCHYLHRVTCLTYLVRPFA